MKQEFFDINARFLTNFDRSVLQNQYVAEQTHGTASMTVTRTVAMTRYRTVVATGHDSVTLIGFCNVDIKECGELAVTIFCSAAITGCTSVAVTRFVV